jgi:hypothetical protein
MSRNGKATTNLDVIRDLLEDLEGFFEAFVLDKHWNDEHDKVTICFTAEQIKSSPEIYTKRWLR